jgi:hypothetical protein
VQQNALIEIVQQWGAFPGTGDSGMIFSARGGRDFENSGFVRSASPLFQDGGVGDGIFLKDALVSGKGKI